jgi:hypothetical protein
MPARARDVTGLIPCLNEAAGIGPGVDGFRQVLVVATIHTAVNKPGLVPQPHPSSVAR